MEKSKVYLRKFQEARRERSHERVRLLRMEVLLDNAECTKMLVKSLLADPTMKPSEFRQHVEQSHLIAHPEVVDTFIDELVKRRTLVAKTIRDAQRESDQGGSVKAAHVVYDWVVRGRLDDYVPYSLKGKLKIRGSYPLAVILECSNKVDYQKMRDDSSVGEGGFFENPREKSVSTMNAGFRMGRQPFPIIGINGFIGHKHIELYGTEREEKAHAEHAAFRDALAKAEKKFIWARFDGREVADFEAQDMTKKLIEKWVRNPDKTRSSPEWKWMLHVAFSNAKDELLAGMRVRDREIFSKLQKLIWGSYKYFAILGLSANNDLYEAIRKEYREILQKQVDIVDSITRSYRLFCLNERIEGFRWVLAQFPIEQWEKRLRDSMFVEESERLFGLFDKSYKIITTTSQNKRGSENVYDELRSALQNKQHQPLFDVIREYEERLNS